jgi:hypothetical protein
MLLVVGEMDVRKSVVIQRWKFFRMMMRIRRRSFQGTRLTISHLCAMLSGMIGEDIETHLSYKKKDAN